MTVPTRPPIQTQYFPYIDGLRALAVLSVLVYHVNEFWLPGGFVGVDVFFVISGFVVSASVAGFKGQGILHFAGYFYARRITRIFPALIACLLTTALVSALFIPASWLSMVNEKTGLYAFLGLSNFILAQNGRDYFAPTAEFNPYTHTWSLAVEEQFYLSFPLLFLGWLSGGRGRALSTVLFSVFGFASLGWAAWQSGTNPTQAYFLLPSRFWELAAGVLLFQLISVSPEPRASEGYSFFHLVAGVLFLLLVLGALALSTSARFPVPGALPVVIGTLGLIWSLHRHPGLRSLHGLLGNRPLVFIGKISYSLYLWHWPVFVLFRWTWGLDTPLLRAAALAIVFFLAVGFWRLVEAPFRYGLKFGRKPQRYVILGGMVILVCAWGLATVLAKLQPYISLSVVSRQADFWYPHGIPHPTEALGCKANPERLNVDGGRLLIYSPVVCDNAASLNRASLYVIGDSHAIAYEGLFRQYAMRHAVRIHVYTNGGCPFLSLQPWRDLDNPLCRRYTDAALRDLKTRAKPGDVLFLPSLRLARLSDQWVYFGEEKAREEMFGQRAETGRHRAIADAVATLREIAGHRVHIVFEGPKPLFKAPPFRCADWFNRSNPICAPGFSMPRTVLDAFREPVLQSFAEIARKVPGVSVWDPYPILCPEQECSAWRDEKPLFLDGDHISGYGNSLLMPSFAATMTEHLNSQQ
jgi:peptidoglycan/LPS O-acetylase OafA/YrhL